MSTLKKIQEDITLIPAYLEAFDVVLLDENVKKDISIENKTPLDCNSEQGVITQKYVYCLAEARTLMDFVEIHVKQKKTILHRDLIENSKHSFTDREREKLFDDDEEYVKLQILYLEIKERHDKFKGLLDAIGSRGYALNNITKLMVEYIEKTVL